MFILFILFALFACKKTEWEPEGPTDIRVRNTQGTEIFRDVIINTAGTRDTTGNVKKLGTIDPGKESGYKRVSIAFPKAEIKAVINGETFSTGTVNSTYMQYIGLMRITYEVYISDMNKKELTICDVILDEALVP